MGRWESRRDELERTTFHGQLDIEGNEQQGNVVRKKRSVRQDEGPVGSTVSVAGLDDPDLFQDHDTP